MIRIGIIGDIGSGKTFVANNFGYPVFSADLEVAKIYKKAKNLKSQFNKINIVNWGEIPEFDIIINATSLGLNNETIDLNTTDIGGDRFFYDVIYNPNETNFLKLGKKLGNQIENGKFMFIYQAFEAFKLWQGIEPSVNNEVLNLLDND